MFYVVVLWLLGEKVKARLLFGKLRKMDGFSEKGYWGRYGLNEVKHRNEGAE